MRDKKGYTKRESIALIKQICEKYTNPWKFLGVGEFFDPVLGVVDCSGIATGEIYSSLRVLHKAFRKVKVYGRYSLLVEGTRIEGAEEPDILVLDSQWVDRAFKD